MKRTRCAIVSSAIAVYLVAGSGCSLQALKESNRRLKESNDRLISENNRLEEEIASLERKGAFSPGEDAVVDSRPPVPAVAQDLARGDPARLQEMSQKDRAALLLDDGVEVSSTKQGIRLRVPDRVFFAPGQANLSKKGESVLDKVARLIKSYPGHMVRVDGHTDDTPTRKVRHIYPTNWELSTARACKVVRYLVERGQVNSSQIFPAGFSQYHPVSAGRSTAAQSQNRRVEITILNDNV